MGSDVFMVISKSKNAQEAFKAARDKAFYDYGHRGYSGTIAEKDSFVMIPVSALPEGMTYIDYANLLIDKADERIDDKWGPAGCIDCGNGEYLFFGWASS